MKQWVTSIIKLMVAAGLIYWLVQSGRFDVESLSKINSPELWFGGIGIFLFLLVINSFRWKCLLQLEDMSISLGKAYQLSLMGIFFNFFMPGGVGGDVVKAGYLMGDYPNKKWFIGWSILVDRVFGMLALLLYSGITGLIFYDRLPGDLQWSIYSLSLIIVLGFVSLIAIIIFSPKDSIDNLLLSSPFAEKTLRPLFYFFRRPKKIVLPFLLSLVGQAMVMSIGVFLLVYLQIPMEIWMILLVFPFGFLATILPISPAGIGVGQTAFYFLFDRVAEQGEFGVLIISFFQAIQFFVGLLGGLLFVVYKKEKAN